MPPTTPEKYARNDYYVVATKLANSEQDPTTNSARFLRAAVHSSALIGGSRNNVSLRTGDWVLDRVLESPDWLIRIARRALGDRFSAATVTAAGIEEDQEGEHHALFLSTGTNGREALLLLNNSPAPVDPNHLIGIPRIGIGACVLNSCDLEGKQEKDVLLEQVGLVSPNDFLFEHVAFAMKYAKSERDVFIYLTTEIVPSFMNRKVTGKRGRDSDQCECDVYRLWVHGEYPHVSGAIEKLSPYLEGDEAEGDEAEGDEAQPQKTASSKRKKGDNSLPREDDHFQVREKGGTPQRVTEAGSLRHSSDVTADKNKANAVGNERLNHARKAETRQHEQEESDEVSKSGDEEEPEEEETRGLPKDTEPETKFVAEKTSREIIANSSRNDYASDASHTSDVESSGHSDGNAVGDGNDDIQGGNDEVDDKPSSEDAIVFYPRELILLHHMFVGKTLNEKEKKWLSFYKLSNINQKDVKVARRILKPIDRALKIQRVEASGFVARSRLLLTSKTSPKPNDDNGKGVNGWMTHQATIAAKPPKASKPTPHAKLVIKDEKNGTTDTSAAQTRERHDDPSSLRPRRGRPKGSRNRASSAGEEGAVSKKAKKRKSGPE